MILGHQPEIVRCVIARDFIFSFHMPLFFIVSGLFYRKKPIIASARSNAKRLLLPYIITAIIVSVISCFDYFGGLPTINGELVRIFFGSGSIHKGIIFGDIYPVGAIWFLLALFWCKTIYNATNNLTKYANLICLMLAVIFSCIGSQVIMLPMGINEGISAMMFYIIGRYFNRIKRSWYFPLIVCWIVSIAYFPLFMVRCYYGFYPVNVLGAIGGTFVMMQLSRWIYRKSKLLTKIFVWLGNNTLFILCIHLIFLCLNIWADTAIANIPALRITLEIGIYCVLVYALTYVKAKHNLCRALVTTYDQGRS